MNYAVNTLYKIRNQINDLAMEMESSEKKIEGNKLYLVTYKDNNYHIHTELYSNKNKAYERYYQIVRTFDTGDELPDKLDGIYRYDGESMYLIKGNGTKHGSDDHLYWPFERCYDGGDSEVQIETICIDEVNKRIDEVLNDY